MSRGDLITAAVAAYLAGKGYYVDTHIEVPGKGVTVDTVAAAPRMKELKIRLKRGFAPTGVINHLIDVGWTPLSALAAQTGHDLNFTAAVLEDAARDGWVELGFKDGAPSCRIKDYRVPARECLLAFNGAEDLDDKIDRLKALEGSYHGALFVFPYDLDDKTIETIVRAGAGIVKYHQSQGVLQELVPAEMHEIDDVKQFAMLVERVLYNNAWIMTEEII